MPTREPVLGSLDYGDAYATAGHEPHIPAGLAFMTATGLAAAGSDAPTPQGAG
jgi:hypothetical protein